MILEARDLVLSHRGRPVIRGVDLAVRAGEVVAVVGPNGSGKSTLLRGLARLHPPDRGTVMLDGREIRHLGSREVARRLAILPQAPAGGLDLTVRELVFRGRYPHQGLMLRARAEDFAAVRAALEACDVEQFADRPLAYLSGGERQRAWLALALAQQPQVLLLDEPTSFLDFEHQLQVMAIISGLRSSGIAVVAVLHDLALAARYADRIVAITEGRIAFDGPPAEVLTPGRLERVFRVRMDVIADPATGGPLPVPAELLDGARATGA